MYVLISHVNSSRVITDKRARVNFECLNFSIAKTIEPDDAVSGESLFLFLAFIYQIYYITAMLVIIFAYIIHTIMTKSTIQHIKRFILIQLKLSNRIIDLIWLFGVLLDDPRVQLDRSKFQLDIL